MALLLSGAMTASAQTNYPTSTNTVIVPFGPPKLSLDEAREVSFQRNWDLLAAKSGIDAADAQLIIAKEFPNPTASLTTAKWGARTTTPPWSLMETVCGTAALPPSRPSIS